MIEFLSQPNVITGLPRQFIFLLVLIAFRSYALRRPVGATAYIGTGMFWIVFSSFGRSVWWDIFMGFGLGNQSNVIWNSIGLLGGVAALHGFLLLLPKEDQDKYNILTVAFYPRRLWRRLDRKD